MRSDELSLTVGDYVTLQRGSTYKGALVGHPGPPLLGLGSIEPGGGFRSAKFKTFGGECPERWMVEPGSIYVALKGATKDGSMVGSVARLPLDVPAGRLTQDTARLDFIDEKTKHRDYLYWVLRSPQYRDYCSGRITGSASASFSREDFLSYPIPPISRLRSAIVKTLEGIEAKIEQSRRTCGVLERLARAMFKAWFVDFEPVKAKAAGATGFPSMPQHVFNTLPTTFTDSELGPIPQGWVVKTIGDVCDVNSRSIRNDEISGPIEYVSISSVTRGRLDEIDRFDFSDAPGRARRLVQDGDTIWSCVRPNRMSHLYIHDPPPNRIVSTGFAVISPRKIGPSFLYLLTTQPEFVDYLVANATGSAYPAVRGEDFENAQFCCPLSRMLEVFEDLTQPMRRWMGASELESRKLAEMRDYLLPKLMSGEVRVGEAQDLAGELV